MTFPKLRLNPARLGFNILIILLFILLFIFPNPAGPFFTIAKILLFIGLVFNLFRDMASDGKDREKRIESPSIENEQSNFPSEHSTDQSRRFYDNLLSSVFGLLKALNESYRGALYMVDPMSNGFTLQNSSSGEFIDFVPKENQILTTILTSDETVLFQQKDSGIFWDAIFNTNDWRGSECLLGIRVVYRGITVGCLLVFIDHFNKLEQQDRQVISIISQFIAQGIEKIERTEELFSDRENHSRITALLGKIELGSDDDAILETILELCRQLFSYDKLTISLARSGSDVATTKLVDGFNQDIGANQDFPLEATLHGRLHRTKKVLLSSYWEKDFNDSGRFRTGDTDLFNFMSVAGVPFQINRELSGAIMLERLSSRQFSESDLWLLETLGETLGPILEWSTNYQIIHQHATHDGLTQLLNHKSFLERFEEEISRSLRFQQDLVLLMMDLDKFKRVNDNYGHLHGDYVLRETADQLKQYIRNIDVVARYGGEEFAILLINTNKKKAVAVAKRIAKAINGHRFVKDGIEIQMAISIGLAQYPADADRIKGLIAKADAAMYRVKGRGGNGVESHQ